MTTATMELRKLEYMEVSIDGIIESKTNPRKHFAKEQLADLTSSVREKGILVPLLVRPIGEKFEIVAGARRYRAARAAELETVPVLIRELTDEQALEVQVIENLQRQDVHPLEEAEGYKQLLERGKYEIASLAAKVGKSESYIYQRLKLAELVPAAKKAFLEEKITAGHAILLARLQAHEQKEGLNYCNDRWRKPSVRDLSDWINQNVHLDLAKAPWKKDDAELVPAAGACTTCPKRTGFAKALFPDVQKTDTCTDPKCFMEKGAALIQIRIKENPGLQLVSGSAAYSLNDQTALQKRYPGLLMDREYRKAGAIKCKDTAEALVVEGDGAGTKIRICTGKRCRKHGAVEQSYRPRPKSAKEIAVEKRQRERREIEERVLNAAHVEAIQKARKLKALPAAVWRWIAQGLSYSFYGNNDPIAKAFSLKPNNNSQEKALAKMSPVDVAAFLFAIATDPTDGSLPQKRVLESFSAVGVDVESIRKRISAEAKTAKAGADVCRICKCTQEKACRYIEKGVTRSCSWIDESRTLCTNPLCIAAAKKLQTSAKKKAA